MITAINQPYFSPYASYYALIRNADIFVLYDCVQFIRRGRIHRSQLHINNNTSSEWLTLPIVKAPQDTLIKDIQLKPLDSFTTSLPKPYIKAMNSHMDLSPFAQGGMLIDLLEQHHKAAFRTLNITTKIIRSSSLKIPHEITGQQRIIEICKALKTTHYTNLPGGKSLYEQGLFEKNNIKLSFIKNENVSKVGLLQTLAQGELERFIEESHIALFD